MANEYVLKATQRDDGMWEAMVSLSAWRNNVVEKIPPKLGTPLSVHSLKSAVFEGPSRDAALDFAKQWAEEQAL